MKLRVHLVSPVLPVALALLTGGIVTASPPNDPAGGTNSPESVANSEAMKRAVAALYEKVAEMESGDHPNQPAPAAPASAAVATTTPAPDASPAPAPPDQGQSVTPPLAQNNSEPTQQVDFTALDRATEILHAKIAEMEQQGQLPSSNTGPVTIEPPSTSSPATVTHLDTLPTPEQSITNDAPQKSRRERLAELTKRYMKNEIDPYQYQAQRAKIMSEPEP